MYNDRKGAIPHVKRQKRNQTTYEMTEKGLYHRLITRKETIPHV